MIGGIILFIIIVGFAICMKFGWRPAKPDRTPWKWLISILTLILIACGGWWGYQEYTTSNDKKEAQANSTKTAQRRQNVSALQQSWTFETYDPIPKKGLRVYLYPGWKSFPLGGLIDIKTPDGAIIRHRHGTDLTENTSPSLLRSIEQKGWYTFYPNPLGSERGVIIFNCWTCQQGP